MTNQLQQFRSEVYQNFNNYKRTDTLMDLVDALSDTPEAVVVCEKEQGQTVLRRLERAALAEWLEAYSLGTLWRKGELGGTRW